MYSTGHAWLDSGYRVRECRPDLVVEALVALRELFLKEVRRAAREHHLRRWHWVLQDNSVRVWGPARRERARVDLTLPLLLRAQRLGNGIRSDPEKT